MRTTATRPAIAARRLLVVLTLTAIAITGVTPVTAAPAVDWVDRAAVDVPFADGWRLVGCEGDAPLLCAVRPDGRVGGTIWLGVSDVWPHEDINEAGVVADITAFQAMLGEDRRAACGDGFSFEAHGPAPARVGSSDGYRYGFTLRGPGGDVHEHVVIHLAFVSGLRVVLNTAFSAAGGCPGPDHERMEFAVADLATIEPHLDEMAAASRLPSDLDRGLACADRTATVLRFPETAGNRHHAAIECLARRGLVQGGTDGTYGAARPVTRGQFATMLVRLLDGGPDPLPPSAASPFRDIDDSVHADAIRRLAAAGIVSGVTPTTFAPGRPVTRAQATTMLVRAYEHHQGRALHDAGVRFPDVGATHREALSRAASAGLVTGRSDGGFEPAALLRRDQAATMLARGLNRLAATYGLHTS